MKSRMTIGKKLTWTGAALVGMTAILGIGSLVGMSSLAKTAETIVTDPLPGIYEIGMVAYLTGEYRGDVWRHIAISDASGKQALERELQRLKAQAEEHLQAYDKTITSATDRDEFNRLRPMIAGYLQATEPILAVSREGKTAEASAKYVSETAPLFDALKKQLSAITDLNRKLGQGDADAARAAASTGNTITWALMLLCVGVGIGLMYFIVTSLNRTLKQSVLNLGKGADQVASAASQIASSSQSLAQGASEQAASLEETSASTEEINSMARRNTDNAQSAAALTGQSQQKVQEANASLVQMSQAMTEINESSEKISRIIKVIDEIAFQTNILALNAAVEAARAGEAGMGFAVVADEVRNLAQRSAQAAKDTAALIEESISRSAAGKTRLEQVNAAIAAITAESTQVKTLSDEVNLGSQEQARGIDQIAKTITQMEQVTQKTAASAEESASAAEELTAQSQALKDAIQELEILVGTEHGSSRPAVRKPAPQTAQKSYNAAKSLDALKTAVEKDAGAKPEPEPVRMAAIKPESAIPLDDDDFKSF